MRKLKNWGKGGISVEKAKKVGLSGSGRVSMIRAQARVFTATKQTSVGTGNTIDRGERDERGGGGKNSSLLPSNEGTSGGGGSPNSHVGKIFNVAGQPSLNEGRFMTTTAHLKSHFSTAKEP